MEIHNALAAARDAFDVYVAAGLLCAVVAVLIFRRMRRRHNYAGIRHEPMRLPPEP